MVRQKLVAAALVASAVLVAAAPTPGLGGAAQQEEVDQGRRARHARVRQVARGAGRPVRGDR